MLSYEEFRALLNERGGQIWYAIPDSRPDVGESERELVGRTLYRLYARQRENPNLIAADRANSYYQRFGSRTRAVVSSLKTLPGHEIPYRVALLVKYFVLPLAGSGSAPFLPPTVTDVSDDCQSWISSEGEKQRFLDVYRYMVMVGMLNFRSPIYYDRTYNLGPNAINWELARTQVSGVIYLTDDQKDRIAYYFSLPTTNPFSSAEEEPAVPVTREGLLASYNSLRGHGPDLTEVILDQALVYTMYSLITGHTVTLSDVQWTINYFADKPRGHNKASARACTAILDIAREMAGDRKELTAEEWENYFHLAMRFAAKALKGYARGANMCGQADEAIKESRIGTDFAPVQEVTIKAKNGMVIKIPVRSWSTGNDLLTEARRLWDKTPLEEQRRYIVRDPQIPVMIWDQATVE